MDNVALYTFGILHRSVPAKRMADFRRRADAVYAEASRAPGYVGHAEKPATSLGATLAIGQDFGVWGPYAIPASLPGLTVADVITTLSVWRDVEHARRFVYSGAHGSALMSRHDWFAPGPWPGHVMWRIAEGRLPQWTDGVDKLEGLARHGDSGDHFTFESPWGQAPR